MREILFRAKRMSDGEWVDGSLFIDEKKDKHEILVGYVNYRVGWEVYPNTVGQFTGLTDKKGKKIFEGDRCRVSRPCVLAYGKIAFHNGCFWFVDDSSSMLRLCDAKMNGFEIEVIGDIHDNPELLYGAGDLFEDKTESGLLEE